MNGLTIYNGVRLQCDGKTLWATQKEIASLFGVERSVITKHIHKIFASGELEEVSVCACGAHTATDGKTYQTNLYNLELIIAVGFFVSSRKGIRFRQRAAEPFLKTARCFVGTATEGSQTSRIPV